MSSAPIILIPARLASTRLPDKPLADIGGLPMIGHVWRRAIEADIGPAVVATDDKRIAGVISDLGGQAIMTRSDHPSGSDRIFEALEEIDPARHHDVVVNLQGDLPTLAADALRAVLSPLAEPSVDIATLVAEITDDAERTNSNVVKAVLSLAPDARIGRALYFTRATAPSGDGPLYHHIGIYAYRRAALECFIALPPSPLETRERLEQLRALEAGMRIDAALVDTVPLGVDTAEDLARARAVLGTSPGSQTR